MNSKLNNILRAIGFIILFCIIAYLIGGFLITSIRKSQAEQFLFTKGTYPDPELNGNYKGSAEAQANWIGKSFDSKNNTGINRFSEGLVEEKRIEFKTYQGKGLMDPDVDVLKIDYNIEENPFYIKWILDEIVQVSPGKYLGKVHLRLIPFLPITIMYFELEK